MVANYIALNDISSGLSMVNEIWLAYYCFNINGQYKIWIFPLIPKQIRLNVGQ